MRKCRCLGMCCVCDKQGAPLYRCAGCGHRFCFTCVHRLGEKWACVSCMSVWLEMMTHMELPAPVARWFNDVTL